MSKRISLKNMLAEGFYYDVGTEKNEFESAVASATEQAKKKFEDSMKEKVLNQKVKVRASKGQPGQPEKDYIIDKVSAASVDWYWKQYVVVLKDEKNKEYFLKPGFKVEVLSAAAQPGQPQTQASPKETPPGAEKSPPPVAGPAAAQKGKAAPPPMSADRSPKPKPPIAEEEERWSADELDRYWKEKEKEDDGHTFGTDPRAGVEWERDMDPEDKFSSSDDSADDLDESKKGWVVKLDSESGDHYGPFLFKKEPTPDDIKKLILTKTPEEIDIDGPGEFGSYVYVDISSPEEIGERTSVSEVGGEYKKEWVAEIMGEILWEFLSQTKQEQAQNNPTRAVLPYIKSAKWVGQPGGDPGYGDHAEWLLEIPIEDMQPDLDPKELQLSITTGLRSLDSTGPTYTRGYGEVQKLGRLYRISVEYTIEMDI